MEEDPIYIVEIYDPHERVPGPHHKPGWRYEVFHSKDSIPEEYFNMIETHVFWRFQCKEEDVISKFLEAERNVTGEGLLWTRQKEMM